MTPDGGRVAFAAAGHGYPLVMFAGPANAALEWETPTFAPFLEALVEHLTIVRVEVRGGPNSGPPPTSKLRDYLPDDVMAVVETLGLSTFAAAAAGCWAEHLAALAVRFPHRLSHLVFQLPNIHPCQSDWRTSQQAHDAVASAYKTDQATVRALAFLGTTATEPLAEGLARFVRSLDDGPWRDLMRDKMAERNREIDLAGYLPKIEQSTLVIADDRDPTEGRELASQLRNAVLRYGGVLPFRMTDPDQSRSAAEEVVRFVCGNELPNGSGPSHQASGQALSPREREVLAALATGKTNGEIGMQLGISSPTVARHVANIYGKLGVRNRAQATAAYLSSGHGTP